jgi:hypothetical protein
MPTRKQRRRKQKSQRHEYEYVYVDEEGQEVEAPPEPARTARATTKSSSAKGRQQPRRPGRAPREPSLPRSAAMGAGFAVVLLVFSTHVGKHPSSLVSILPVAIIWAAVLTFTTYWVERRVYRSHLKRSGLLPAEEERPAGARRGLFRRR